MDVDASAAPGVGQDAALDTTTLPADHVPKFFAEAKRVYGNSRAPFVNLLTGKVSEGYKRPIFVAKNGQRPLLPIRSDLVARKWGPLAGDGIYWTLDLNGERFIVQSFPNKGCVSGAKWVYCRWTGQGEEFEELPVAFSCINGEYSNALGPRTESTAANYQPTAEKSTLTGATADNLRHNHPPPRKITPLPEDHPVEYLGEAKALYAASKPPFAILKTRKSRRPVLLAMEDGQFVATSTEAEVVYRQWDSNNDYPTLDLGGKRFIVCGNAGGYPGGYQYHLWLGSKRGRIQKVVAYSGRQTEARNIAPSLTEHLPEVDEDPGSSSSFDEDENQELQAGTTEDQQYLYDDFRKAFDLTAIPSSTPTKFSVPQSMVSSEPSAQKERPRRKSKPTKRARSPPAQFGSRKGKAPTHGSMRISGRARYASDDSSGLSSPPYDTPAPTPSIKGRPAPNSEPKPQVPTSLPTLTLYKQTHTTLRATRDSNVIGFVPLRLLSCMTMSTLFSNIIAASGHSEHEEPIKCLMAVFDWKDETDVYKTIYIDKGTEGSFEIFLETIDEAPCWKDEGGKCGVAIEVVRA